MTQFTHHETGKQIELPELIDLQSANMTQNSKDSVKEDWHIRKNITGEVLEILPSYIRDKDMFTILNFSKKFELIAFNAGINFQKKHQNEYYVAQINHIKQVNKDLADENIRLSTLLENILNKE